MTRPPCERCGATRCGPDCALLAKMRTNQTCAICKQRILVGQYARLRAAKGRGHYEFLHAQCSRALYPSPAAPGEVMSPAQDGASPAESLLSVPASP